MFFDFIEKQNFIKSSTIPIHYHKIFMTFPQALKYTLIPILYKNKMNFDFMKNNFNYHYNLRLLNFSKIIKYSFWVSLFSIKRFVFSIILIKSKIIICNVGYERELSKFYLKTIKRISNEKKAIIVSFNIITSLKYLFDPKVFYYRKVTFQKLKNVNPPIVNFINEIFNVINKYDLIEYITEEDKKLIFKAGAFLFKEYLNFDNFISKYKSNIICLIQDYDYTYNKYIYCQICKYNNIKTIAFQHSILFSNHLYKRYYSNFSLLWGMQEKERLLNNGTISKIEIIGAPITKKISVIQNKRSKNFVLFLSSHFGSMIQTVNRQIDYTLKIINKINLELLEIDAKYKLWVVPHPNDSKKYYCNKHLNITTTKEINKKFKNDLFLLMFEDTTLIFDYFLSDIPIIYIQDEALNDPLMNSYFSSILFYNFNINLKSLFNKKENFTINLTNRRKHLDYFLSDQNNYDSLLTKLISNI